MLVKGNLSKNKLSIGKEIHERFIRFLIKNYGKEKKNGKKS